MKTFEKLDQRTLVINHLTAKAYISCKENIWTLARSGVSMILLSLEILQTDGFRLLTESLVFSRRICALDVDEVHLCNTWNVKFHTSYTMIGFARSLLLTRTAFVLTTATLMAGAPMDNALTNFGLVRGRFHFIRCFNVQHNI